MKLSSPYQAELAILLIFGDISFFLSARTNPDFSDSLLKIDKLPSLSLPLIYILANYSCDILTKLKYVP
ncbi:hypothetical protein Mpsy_0548 [Methanolobus psychrophilus R15]|nr:hypothetical protein Mpsy_0548 [Methanolobus psychrophilus R15]